MDSTKIFTFCAIFAIFVPSILAAEFLVGDGKGWTINFDYQAWATGKEFRVGDKLVFKYPEGAHNVHKVNGTGFQQCLVPPATEALTSGNDVITLATPGRKWYICGVGKHCEVGNQKLFITVLPQLVPPASSPFGYLAPGPSPTSSAAAAARGSVMSMYYAWMVAILVTLTVAMV